MSLVNRRLSVTLAAITVVAACETPSLLPPPDTWTARIIGTVRSANGEAVPGAAVIVRSLFIDGVGDATLGRCSGSKAPSLAGRTDSSGRFAIEWHGAVDPAFICMHVEGSGVMGGQSVAGLAELDSVTLGPTGVDSLRVSVVARPQAQP